MYHTLRDRNIPPPATLSAQAGPIQTGTTYAQATQGYNRRQQPNMTTLQTTYLEQPPNEEGELKQIMTNLINQMNTLINLITALVAKSK
jgi:esterase/lipase